MSYAFNMTTNSREFVAERVRAARLAGEAARHRRARMAQWQALGLGAALAVVGLLLAVLYCLMTHRLLA